MDNVLRYSPIILFVSILLLALGFSVNHSKENITKAEVSYMSSLHKQDSLQNVIDSLQTDIRILEDGFDEKESRYSNVIDEYQFGIAYLKDYHPSAYKDFHRIIGMKERYSIELERENKQRLNQYK